MSPRDAQDDFPEMSPPRRKQASDGRPGTHGAPARRTASEPAGSEQCARSPLRFGRYIALFS